MPDRDLTRRQSCRGDAHQHFEIPAIGRLAHPEASERVAPNGAEGRHVGETHAVDETQQQAGQAAGGDLLQRKASRLMPAAQARAVHEGRAPFGDRRDQCRNEFWIVAAVAIEKQQNIGIGARRGNSGLHRPAISALAFDDDVGARRPRAFDRAVARAAIDHHDF